VVVDGPAPGSNASGTVIISGWAIDSTVAAGLPITSVKVQVDGGTAADAMYGISRPDVCAGYAGRPGCPNVGYVYALNTAGLSSGAHTVTVSATNSASATGSAEVTFNVGGASPSVVVESPTAGSVVSGGITVNGWALDNTAPAGAAIRTVNVLVDNNLVGTATYGVSRPDVCVNLSPEPGCLYAGFSYPLDTSGLSVGPHTLTVIATNGSTPEASGSYSVAFQVGSGLSITVDSPTAGAVVNGVVTLSGWTARHLALTGRASGPVLVKVDGNVVGHATAGMARPDVCRHPGKSIAAEVSATGDCTGAGFFYLLDTRALTPGVHLLTVSTTGADGTPDSWTTNFSVPAATERQP
jgi:hypothetical protein